MTLPDGWSDSELHGLLRLLRKHMTLFIYTTDETFAKSIQRHLRCGKDVHTIKEAVRELMGGLSFAMKTRKFTNEVIIVDDASIYPYEHMYETMVMQPENRQGGVWDPDELRTGIRKMETCRHFFDENPERFFTRAAIWSKNVPDVRTKFYLWREIYLEEMQVPEEVPRLDGDLKRLECLRRIFEGVPPAPSPLPPTPSPVGSVAGQSTPAPVRIGPSISKPGKSRIWTPEDLEAFVQLLVEITLELQTKGTSPLVDEMAVRLNRTEPSLIGKFQDIRARYEKRMKYHRAAEIPSIIYDETSVAHKIFTADWSDRGDPYSLVYFALKGLQNKAVSRSKNKNRNTQPPPLQMEMRQRLSSALTIPDDAAASSTTPKTTSSARHAKPQIHPVTKITSEAASTAAHRKPPRVPIASSALNPQMPMYSEFVRECAAMIKWDEGLTYKLCVTIKAALPVYATSPREMFYVDVARAMGGALDRQVVFFRGERILRLCERRYGSLDCFAAAVEGSGESIDVASPTPASPDVAVAKQPSPLKSSRADTTEAQSPAVDSLQAPSPASPSPSSLPSPSALFSVPPIAVSSRPQPLKTAPIKGVQPVASQTAKQILDQKIGSMRTVGLATDRTESSPSVDHYSPDHDAFDYDGDENGDVEEMPQHVDDELDTQGGEAEVDIDDEDDATQSLGSSDFASDVSSDYGHDDLVAGRHQQHTHQHYHRSRYGHASVPGKVHVSSHKTLVVKHAPRPCDCDDCERRRHARHHHHLSVRESAMTSVHRKRSHSELYTETGRWVENHHHAVHEIARRHFHSDPYQRDRHHNHKETAAFSTDQAELMSDHEMAEMDSLWKTLMAPVEKGIAELEAKRREQRERAMDREMQKKEAHWKKELRQQVRDEWRATAASGERQPARNHVAAER